MRRLRRGASARSIRWRVLRAGNQDVAPQNRLVRFTECARDPDLWPTIGEVPQRPPASTPQLPTLDPMPEGHVIHRYARQHRTHFGGRPVRAWSPQGRFADGAARIDGSVLDDVEAHGKHLFYRFDGSDSLYVHLGLIGRFRLYKKDPPDPTPGTRLALEGPAATMYLAGPMACRLVDPAEEAEIRQRLGPDPLLTDDGADDVKAALRRRRIPIGAALLDQTILAGVGNVYRSELLFLCGIDPRTPANELTDAQVEDMWSHTVTELRRGERAGRISTVQPADVGARRRSDLRAGERLYVYKRHGEPCRRCRSPIQSVEMAGRNVWFCGVCQF